MLAIRVEFTFTLKHLMARCRVEGLGGDDECGIWQSIRDIRNIFAQPHSVTLGGACGEVAAEFS
ncbi:hypothetical protein BKH36_03670 [Actinomyces naeslundii]|nr:hypothetical protein BKH36_03670 [Actinomyces naeslundii]